MFTDFSKHVILFDNVVYELKAFSKEGARVEMQQCPIRENLEQAYERELDLKDHKMTKWHNFLARRI